MLRGGIKGGEGRDVQVEVAVVQYFGDIIANQVRKMFKVHDHSGLGVYGPRYFYLDLVVVAVKMR